MNVEELDKPCLPIAYALITLEQVAARGVPRETMLQGLNFPPGLLDAPEAKFSVLQYSMLILKALQLTRDPGLGFDFGLRCSLTAHGFWTFGAISQATVRAAADYTVKFLQLSAPNVSMRMFQDGGWGVLEVREAIPFGPLRQYTFEMFIVTVWRAYQVIAAQLPTPPPAEMWFEWPEPPYFTHYRARLPTVRFGTGVNQLRIPASSLDLALPTANAMTAKMVEERSEQEVMLLGHGKRVVDRVRAALVNRAGAYPDIDAIARTLCVSVRTLKRKLGERRTTFRQLLDEARHRDSLRLLQDPTLTIEDIALRVGYADPANFTRAFRKWTGKPPFIFRGQLPKA